MLANREKMTVCRRQRHQPKQDSGGRVGFGIGDWRPPDRSRCESISGSPFHCKDLEGDSIAHWIVRVPMAGDRRDTASSCSFLDFGDVEAESLRPTCLQATVGGSTESTPAVTPPEERGEDAPRRPHQTPWSKLVPCAPQGAGTAYRGATPWNRGQELANRAMLLPVLPPATDPRLSSRLSASSSLEVPVCVSLCLSLDLLANLSPARHILYRYRKTDSLTPHPSGHDSTTWSRNGPRSPPVPTRSNSRCSRRATRGNASATAPMATPPNDRVCKTPPTTPDGACATTRAA